MRFDSLEDVSFLKGLTDVEALNKLDRITLFRIKGQDSSKCILISVMLHGSEPCGFRAFLKEINDYLNKKTIYPFDVYFLIGNVKAAKLEPVFTHRLLPGGSNYNRIFVDKLKNEDEIMAKEILDFLSDKNVQGHLDLHSFNAKGTDAHSFTSSTDEKNLSLVKKLVNSIFIIDDVHGALIQKTIKFGPACVVECGTNNSKEADQFAFQTMQTLFIEFALKKGENVELDNDVFVNMINVKIRKDVSVAWSNKKEEVKLTLRDDVESLNIKELPNNEFLGWTDNLDVFVIKNKNGLMDPTEVFELREGKIYTKEKFVPNLMAAKEFITKESGFYFFTKKIINIFISRN